jgi:xanthine dehydrogenase YagS FAD-binding subunit
VIRFPTTLDDLAGGGLRAGGTDLMDRRRLGRSGGPIVDLRDVAGLDAVLADPGGLHIGAMVRIADLAAHPDVRLRPGLAEAAAGLATPAIRAVATVGGNLLQRMRCWYFRTPGFECFRSGGVGCRARTGDASHHACFDVGPCVSPHPSTLAVAFLAFDAGLLVKGGPSRLLADLYDASDPVHEHQLRSGEVLTGVSLPVAIAGERSAWVRVSSRARAEWPLCEAVVRIDVVDGAVQDVRIALGGVAPIPYRALAAENALRGGPATVAAATAAATLASADANPLPGTEFKLKLVDACVEDALVRALER